MEFSLDIGTAKYRILSYTIGCITVNTQSFYESIIVMPENLISDWGPKSVPSLEVEHFQCILSLKPQIVLLGTGASQHFPESRLFSCLTEKSIGVEVMSTAAACRTYALLMAEGRNVAAALLTQ